MKCEEKTKYLDRASAEAAVARTRRRIESRGRSRRKHAIAKFGCESMKGVVEQMNAYRCSECTFWHIGKNHMLIGQTGFDGHGAFAKREG